MADARSAPVAPSPAGAFTGGGGAATTPVVPYPARVMTEQDSARVQLYMRRERMHRTAVDQQIQRQQELYGILQKDVQFRAATGGWFGSGYRGYGNATTGSRFHILIPSKRKRPVRTKEVRFTRQQLQEQAEREDILVPIRLDLEADGHKLRDVFTWNLSESLIAPEQFAEVLCHDMKLPTTFISLVARSIRDQLDDYRPFVGQQEMLMAASSGQVVAGANAPGDDLRINVKLEISELNTNRIYVDQLEWDLTNDELAPEQAAAALATDMSLSGEYCTAIAHSIREQSYVYGKTLSLLGHGPGVNVLTGDDELRSEFLPTVTRVARPVVQTLPILSELTDIEMDKIERDAERDVRRKRRQTRNRRHVVLPDREPIRTSRTMPHEATTNPESPSLSEITPQRSVRQAKLRARQETQDQLRGSQSPLTNNNYNNNNNNNSSSSSRYSTLTYQSPSTPNTHMALNAARTPAAPLATGPMAATQHCHACNAPLQNALIIPGQASTPARLMCRGCSSLQPMSMATPASLVTPARAVPLSVSNMPLRHLQTPQSGIHSANLTLSAASAGPSTPTEVGAAAAAPVTASPAAATKPMLPAGPVPVEQWPAWLSQAVSHLRSRYPDDQFDIVREASGSVVVRCQDCDDTAYPLQLPEHWNAFEAHLRSRSHRAIVDMRSA